jgi:sugar/nucleoside kinase (ribokinase family)
VAAELGSGWAEAFATDVFVALAWQGVLRQLRAAEPVRAMPLRPDALSRRADVLFVSAEDVAGGGAPLHELLADGQQLYLTHGGHGALHLRRAAGQVRMRFVPPRPRREPLDTTGAGDVFLAANLAARLAAPDLIGTADEWRLDAVAAAAASLHVSQFGLSAVPSLADLCRELLRQPT